MPREVQHQMKLSQEQHDLLNKITWDAYDVSKTNRAAEFADFEANIDILECRRTEKDYDWQSDGFYPEAPAIFLTEASQEAVQYFASRDFVDVFLENGSDPAAMLACKVAKKTINLALNNKEIHHYQKYMQAREINRLAGYVYALCWWEQEVKQIQVGVDRYTEAKLDENGDPVRDELGSPLSAMREQPRYADQVIIDRFNWMPLDPRNVFTGNAYSYSPQDEDIIIRAEKTIEELRSLERQNNYINLDLLEKTASPTQETDTSQETYNQADRQQKAKYENKPLDLLCMYGKRWAVVKSRDRFGCPKDIEPGYDDDGKPKDKAEFIRVRHEMVYNGSTKVTIRFQAEPLRDGSGRPYKPICRGLSFVHATKKTGMSTAKYIRESQVALNDTFNLSNDRVKLATLPTMIANSYEAENNDELYIEPEHVIPLNGNIDEVFKELKISDNIQGAMMQASVIRGMMDQVAAVYPTTMGDAGKSGVTATATQGSETRSSVRNNYKALTFTYTFDSDLYWMILQMAWQFMHMDTITKTYTPEEVQAFKPVDDYTYQPVTANVELEANKFRKIQNYDQIIGRISGLAQGNPAIIPIIAYIVGRQLELLGDEFRAVEPMIKKLTKTPMQPDDGGQPGGDQSSTPQAPKDMQPEMTSNQHGMRVGATESMARGM